MTMGFDTLSTLLPPPANPTETASDDDWQRIEKQLGLALPADYKAFMAAYGGGRLNDFIGILSPTSRHQHVNFERYRETMADVYQEMQDDQLPIVYSIYPPAPGLLPWGVTDNGNMLSWLVDGPPSTWKVVVSAPRCEEVEVYDMGFADFLSAWLKGELPSDELCEASGTPRFEPRA